MAKAATISNWELLFNASVGVRYHMARQRFFERYHRGITALSLILSSSAYMAISSNTAMAKWLALTVAILQALDLVIDTGSKSRLHNELRQRYIRLEKSFIGIQDLTEKKYAEYQATLQAIELDEPPIHKTVITLSQNEAIHVLKVPGNEGFKKVSWIKRLMAYFI